MHLEFAEVERCAIPLPLRPLRPVRLLLRVAMTCSAAAGAEGVAVRETARRPPYGAELIRSAAAGRLAGTALFCNKIQTNKLYGFSDTKDIGKHILVKPTT